MRTESACIDEEVCEEFMKKIILIKKDCDVFNAEETGLREIKATDDWEIEKSKMFHRHKIISFGL